MLYQNLAEIIHSERQAEIERTLKVRRLLERFRPDKAVPTRTPSASSGARQPSPGAAS